jgi:hypothetical protein
MDTCLYAAVQHFGRHARLTRRAGKSHLVPIAIGIMPLGKVFFMLISLANNKGWTIPALFYLNFGKH